MHDLVVLCGQARDGECLERCELGNGFVPLRQAFLELGDLGLEPLDLRDPRVDNLSCLSPSTKAPLELFGGVLVRTRASNCHFLWIGPAAWLCAEVFVKQLPGSGVVDEHVGAAAGS
ncbi:hypothetical protein [Streptomyces sp. NBC_01518]|uniref:hypothetical protein n=1 Tax=Streptomyces sp. NBC_01518 TaxID=2903891 RepID=UPI00386879D6